MSNNSLVSAEKSQCTQQSWNSAPFSSRAKTHVLIKHHFYSSEDNYRIQIVGNTVFNMLKMTECDVDDNEKPRTIHKITGVEVLTNPFDDIKPRQV